MLLFGFCCYLYSLGSQIIAKSCFLVNRGNKKKPLQEEKKEPERHATIIPALEKKKTPYPPKGKRIRGKRSV